MHKLSQETLELFRTHQFRVSKHLDKIVDAGDRAEIDRVRMLFAKRAEDRKNCKACDESMKTRGFVCDRHFHDYTNQGYECCWTCYVCSVFEDQLGIPYESL